jgi:hypothetical protein
LIYLKPAAVRVQVDDSDWRGFESRSVEPLTCDEGNGSGAHLALEQLTVRIVIVAVGLQPQQVSDPHVQLESIDGAREHVLGTRG